MKMIALKTLAVISVLLTGISMVLGQPGGGRVDVAAFANETAVYEGRVSRLKIGVSVADLTFVTSIAPDSNELTIKTDALSKGTLLKLFKYSFAQSYTSSIDLSSFRVTKTVKHDVQKERVRDSEAYFDYSARRVTWTETDPRDKMRPPRRIASDLPGDTQDMVSGIYYMRLQPLVVGKRIDLTVSDSGLVYQVPVVVTKREQLGTEIGRVWCFRLEPAIFGPGRLIEQKGKMVIWITDDARRIPVKAAIDSQYGKIEIKLKSYKKEGQPSAN